MLLPIFLGPHTKRKKREKEKNTKNKKIVGRKPKRYISEKRIPECLKNS
jgi:hypothetical protein